MGKKAEFKQYYNAKTINAKLFEYGDQDGYYHIVFKAKHRRMPYIYELGEKIFAEFGQNYLCKRKSGQRFFVNRDLFERDFKEFGYEFTIDSNLATEKGKCTIGEDRVVIETSIIKGLSNDLINGVIGQKRQIKELQADIKITITDKDEFMEQFKYYGNTYDTAEYFKELFNDKKEVTE
jgi:hypothetical protein